MLRPRDTPQIFSTFWKYPPADRMLIHLLGILGALNIAITFGPAAC
jgi:hypothetical protein